MSLTPYYLPDTETHVVHSVGVDQDYLISVALPFHYHDNPQKTYPVIYVLDANLYFGMVIDMVRAMNLRVTDCNELPDALIVGIGYPVTGSLTESHAQVMHLRMRDLTQTHVEEWDQFIQQNFPVAHPLETGGAEKFLFCLQHELMPLVASSYRITPNDTTLLGHSWGGWFGLYTLFKQPTLFQRYVMVSPHYPFDLEQEYSQSQKSLPVRLYIALGEGEENDVPVAGRFIDVLKDRHYDGLMMQQRIYPRHTHCSVVASAFVDGLLFVLT